MSSSPYADFSGEQMLAYLAEVDAELPTDSIAEIAIIGGGALLLNLSDRRTTDIDVVSEGLSAEVRRVGALVARRHNLRPDWINDQAKLMLPDLDAHLEVVFRGEHLKVYAAGPQYLLATKLFSGRQKDIDDAVHLATTTGIITADSMLDLLEVAYPGRLLTPGVEYFVRSVAERVQGVSPTVSLMPAPESTADKKPLAQGYEFLEMDEPDVSVPAAAQQCGRVGVVSRKPCILRKGHPGSHRYK